MRAVGAGFARRGTDSGELAETGGLGRLAAEVVAGAPA
jgi:hypothetical protein